MTQETSIINSEEYWDGRFRLDWEEKGGRAQSRFFADLAIKNLPDWLIDRIRQDKLSVADWGCAFGDGTDVLADCFGSDLVTGVDFSSVAINDATERFARLSFRAENWLTEMPLAGRYDVVFSSNTLEHFHEPFDVLCKLCDRTNGFAVAMVPFRERERIDEHFYTFLPENVPVTIGAGFILVSAKVVDCRKIENSFWSGEQIILVYAHRDILPELSLTLDQLTYLLGEVDANLIPELDENKNSY